MHSYNPPNYMQCFCKSNDNTYILFIDGHQLPNNHLLIAQDIQTTLNQNAYPYIIVYTSTNYYLQTAYNTFRNALKSLNIDVLAQLQELHIINLGLIAKASVIYHKTQYCPNIQTFLANRTITVLNKKSLTWILRNYPQTKYNISLSSFDSDRKGIPTILAKLLDKVRLNSTTQGLFRKSVDKDIFHEFYTQISSQDNAAIRLIEETNDIHLVCSTIKRLLQQMEYPLLSQLTVNLELPTQIISSLTEQQYSIIDFIFDCLRQIVMEEEYSLMNFQSLAILISPCLIRPELMMNIKSIIPYIQDLMANWETYKRS